MDYVTIRGKDLNDCFLQMKMKYGAEAHVYEKKVITEGGVFGTGFLANKIYEIKIAIPEKASSKERVEKKLNDLKELLRKKSTSNPNQSIAAPIQNQPTISPSSPKNANQEQRRSKEIPSYSDWVNEEQSQWKEEIIQDNSIREPEVPGLSFVEELIHSTSQESFPTLTSPKSNSLSMEWKESSPHKSNDLSHGLMKLKSKMIDEGMSPEYVSELISETELHLSPLERGKYSLILDVFSGILMDRIRVDSDLFSGTGKGRRKVVFFIGPTGAGKTTNIAKLAAKYNLHMGRSVSLYTTDNFRIAAVEQLKRYADTMDLPFYSVKDVRKFREALLRDGSELVLVDTAGYSHRDKETLYKMKEYYSALGDRDELENILVVSSTVSNSNAKQVFHSYLELGYNRVILSKLDETDYLGSFVELADINTKEFAYLSVGQDVPFDILGAEKKLLAECVVYPEKMKGIKGEVFSKKS